MGFFAWGGPCLPRVHREPPNVVQVNGGGPTPCLSFPIALYPLKLGLGGPEGGPTPCPIAPPAGGGSTRGSSGGSAPGHNLAAWGIWGMKGFWGGGAACACLVRVCVCAHLMPVHTRVCACAAHHVPGGGVVVPGPPPAPHRSPALSQFQEDSVRGHLWCCSRGRPRARCQGQGTPSPSRDLPQQLPRHAGAFFSPNLELHVPGLGTSRWARAGHRPRGLQGHAWHPDVMGCRVGTPRCSLSLRVNRGRWQGARGQPKNPPPPAPAPSVAAGLWVQQCGVTDGTG